jgi:hypothetical protein
MCKETDILVNMPRMYLKENHPTMIKLAKLCEYADKLGLSIEFTGYGVYFIQDDGKDYRVEDIEPDHIVTHFPPSTEYKLTYEKP